MGKLLIHTRCAVAVESLRTDGTAKSHSVNCVDNNSDMLQINLYNNMVKMKSTCYRNISTSARFMRRAIIMNCVYITYFM